MTSEISFAGIVLGVPTPEIEDYIESAFSLRDIVQFSRASPNVDTVQWNRCGLNLDDRITINRLTWPVGATRWSMFHGILLEDDLAKLRAKHGPQKFRFHDVVCEGMYALTPIPLEQTGDGIYLLTVVDDRYWWWMRTASIAAQSTWTNLYSAIGTALGVTITHPSVASTFLAPASDFFSHYHYLPLLLDAAMQSIGHRLVRNFDGTVEAMSATQALGVALANREYGLRGGGQLEPRDFSLGLPASWQMIFPKSSAGVISRDGHYASSYTPDTQLQRKLGTLRGTDVMTVSSTAIAYYNSAGAIQNATELDNLADALGEAWYRWRLSPYEMTIGGIYEWDLEGMHDVFFEVRDGHAHTSVRRVPVENLERTGHLGTYDDVSYAWDGDHVSRSQTNHGVLIAVPQNLTLSANATALLLPDAETVRVTASGAHIVHGISGGIDGLRKRLWNVGANSFTLAHQSASATAENRIVCSTGANITLAANQSIEIDYHGATLRHMASIAVASNTTVNVTSPGAISWAMVMNETVSATENLVHYYDARLMTLDESSMWINSGKVWLAGAYENRPILSIPYAVRSEDQTKAISNETRSLYSFSPATELVLGVCTAFDQTLGRISWAGRVPVGDRIFTSGTMGTYGSTQFAYEPNNQTVKPGDIGFLWRGVQAVQPMADVAITQAGNGTVPQIQSVVLNGTGNVFKLAYEGATNANATIQFGSSSIGAVNDALAALLGNGTVTATGNGTTGSPYLITWGDNSTHSLIQLGVYDASSTALLTLDWLWLPSYKTNFSGDNVTLGNVTFNGTAFGGNVAIRVGNETINASFEANDFYGWGEITGSNLSASGFIYSWQNAQPADINAFYHSGGGGTFNNGTLWERNNHNIPIGEHVRIYYGDRVNGTVFVEEVTAGNNVSINETQSVYVIAGGGNFTLAFNNGTVTATTGNIAFGASNATVKAALEALANIGANKTTVSGAGTQADKYLVTFQLPGFLNYATMTGSAANLTKNQNYICEYEVTGNGPGSPNLSLQIANGTGPNGTFQGLANTTGNLTFGVPAYQGFGPLRIIGTDANNVTVPFSLGTGLSLSGSNRTLTLNSTSSGNGTAHGANGEIQYSNGSGGFLSEPGFEWEAATDTLKTLNFQITNEGGSGNRVAIINNDGNVTGEQGLNVPDATGAGDVVATVNLLISRLEGLGILAP